MAKVPNTNRLSASYVTAPRTTRWSLEVCELSEVRWRALVRVRVRGETCGRPGTGDRVDRYTHLIERARAGERILIDGGTGSECIRRGVPELSNGWSGGAALSHPDIVRQVHADYIALGVDLVVSNTFATGRNVLEDAGVSDDFEAYNRRAVELAIEARAAAGESAARVVVAGGISNWSFSGNRPTLETLHDNTVEQAKIMPRCRRRTVEPRDDGRHTSDDRDARCRLDRRSPRVGRADDRPGGRSRRQPARTPDPASRGWTAH